MPTGRALAAACLLALTLAGCGRAESRFLPEGSADLALPARAGAAGEPILVIYTQGTTGNRTPDRCEPDAGPRGGGSAVPRVLVDLARGNPDVFVWANCAYAVGDRGSSRLESNRLVPCRVERAERSRWAAADGSAQTKICKRAAGLRGLVRAFLERNPRLRPERVFLAGGSGGAWASLLALRADPALANAAIGFAPAFLRYAEAQGRGAHGLPASPDDREVGDETPALDCGAYVAADDQALCRRLRAKCDPLRRALTAFAVRCRQLDWLAEPSRGGGPLPALVYAFRHDPHEDPATLAPLRDRAGVGLVALPEPPRGERACAGERGDGNAHRCAHRDWFRAEEGGRIERFIRCRVADPGAACDARAGPLGAPASG